MSTITLRSHAPTAIPLVFLFWAIAAIGVTVAHQILDPISAGAAAVVEILIILGAASVTARHATIEFALFAGVGWGMLSIIAEIVATSNLSHPCYWLIGSPARPLLRDLLLVTWIFAPALFARRRS